MAKETTEIDATVVVVSYNTREKLRRCLRSVGPAWEVIVVDNASSDGSADMVAEEFPWVRLVRSDVNLGLGPANNIAARMATRPLVLYLNSDAYPEPGSIRLLCSRFSDPSVVAVGAMLLNPDGSLQDSTANELTLWAVFCEQLYLEMLFRSSAFFSPYWNTRRLAAKGGDQPTTQVMGAALMCRAGLEEFDERFFLYCEDTDLCFRLARHGKILYVPEAKIVHDLGSSSSAARWRAVARYNRGKELYFAIHRGRFASCVCWVLDRLGALLRLLVWLLAAVFTLFCVRRFRDQVLLFARVLAAPLAGPTRS